MTRIIKIVAVTALATYATAPTAQEFNFSGFGSFVGGFTSEEAPQLTSDYNGYNSKDISFAPDSIAGLQITTDVNDKVSATLQLVTRGNDDWNVQADWAYLSFEVSESFQVRAGRLRIPYYLYSDFVTVGYAYTWISPPSSVYALPYDNIDGVDVIYNMPLGNADLQIQGYFGATGFEMNSGELNGAEGDSKNQFGVNFELSHYNFKYRYAYHQASITIDTSMASGGALDDLSNALEDAGFPDNASSLRFEEDTARFHEVGIMYDGGRFVGSAEATLLDFNDKSPFAEQHRYYIMGGVRFKEQFLAHLTWGRSDDVAPNLSSGIPASGPTAPLYQGVSAVESSLPVDNEEWTLGLRWDFTEATALNVELTDVKGKNNSDNDLMLTRFGVQTIF